MHLLFLGTHRWRLPSAGRTAASTPAAAAPPPALPPLPPPPGEWPCGPCGRLRSAHCSLRRPIGGPGAGRAPGPAARHRPVVSRLAPQLAPRPVQQIVPPCRQETREHAGGVDRGHQLRRCRAALGAVQERTTTIAVQRDSAKHACRVDRDDAFPQAPPPPPVAWPTCKAADRCLICSPVQPIPPADQRRRCHVAAAAGPNPPEPRDTQARLRAPATAGVPPHVHLCRWLAIRVSPAGCRLPSASGMW